MIGVVDKNEAIQLAQDADLDLVEVSPNSDPPVCRILDFGKYRYEQSKKERANRAKAKVIETKEVRLGRSMKIDPHDVGIRINQARKFLLDGHKVLIVQNFRGREMMHKERGDEISSRDSAMFQRLKLHLVLQVEDKRWFLLQIKRKYNHF